MNKISTLILYLIEQLIPEQGHHKIEISKKEPK